MDETEVPMTTQTLTMECIICGEVSEIEVPIEISEALGKSILNVCIPCSQKTPEQLAATECAWQWVRTRPQE